MLNLTGRQNLNLLPVGWYLSTPICLLLCALLSLAGCSNKNSPPTDPQNNVLVVVGDTSLTLQDVLVRIPGGMEPQDSAALFHAIVNSWVETQLLDRIALENLDNAEAIEKLVEDFRRKLIVSTYLRQTSLGKTGKISEKRIRQYYDSHKEEMKIDDPLVKGIYLKVPAQSGLVSEIRRHLSDNSENNINFIEKFVLQEAVQYDNFQNRWVSFRKLSEQIPYRFSDPDKFVESTPDFETTYNGSVYFLHISDYLHSGQELPYEYARDLIIPALEEETIAERRSTLVKTLYDKAVNDGVLHTPGYDLYK